MVLENQFGDTVAEHVCILLVMVNRRRLSIAYGRSVNRGKINAEETDRVSVAVSVDVASMGNT